jgi:hypothetical protein
MRQSGLGVQALRPLRGRAHARAWTPTPDPTRPTATEEDQKETGIPGHRGLDDSGATDKQGSRLVRWAAVEAVQRVPARTQLGQVRDRVAARRGRNIGVVAAARELTQLVFYGLRDGHIRQLPAPPRVPAA